MPTNKRNNKMEAKNINQLVTENLNYVKSLANRFKGKGVDFDDLVSEGYMAMTQAAQKYDAGRGTQFIAYAAPFIRKAMEQAIKQQSASYAMSKDDRQHPNKKLSRPLSIDAPLGANNKYTLLDILINKDAQTEEENTYFRLVSEDLKAAIETLDEREREVIRKFYGIGCPHIPMADIAEDMELKRERVRQIRDKAVRKMAKQAKTKVLKTLLRK